LHYQRKCGHGALAVDAYRPRLAVPAGAEGQQQIKEKISLRIREIVSSRIPST
jgi:hypothetical protein